MEHDNLGCIEVGLYLSNGGSLSRTLAKGFLLFRRIRNCLLPGLAIAAFCALAGCRANRWPLPALAQSVSVTTAGMPVNLRVAERAYKTANELELTGDGRCVDAYFEAAKASWYEITDTIDCPPANSARASQLYHSSVAKLVCTATRFGRFDSRSGLTVYGPQGGEQVAVQYNGFLWQPEDFNDFILVGDYPCDKILRKYGNEGLGVPILVVRRREFEEPLRKKEQAFPATVILRRTSEHNCVLELFDPIRVTQIHIGGRAVSIHRDLSAPFAYSASSDGNNAVAAFRSPEATKNGQGLYALEPYQPGKIPIIFVHGLISDSTTWVAMVNELHAQPDIQARYQFWAFEYPTGEPFVLSALKLREELAEAIALLDPHGLDHALSNMVIMGHSMGGLVAKLQVTSSKTYLWESFANRPLDHIVADHETLTKLARASFFEPQPAIKRIIFIATPHRGAEMAQRVVGRIASTFVQETAERKAEHRSLIANNPGVFSPEFLKRIPTSIDLLETTSPVLQAVEKLPISQNVALHSIIGDTGNPLRTPTDGVVPVKSARHKGVESEFYVRSKHTNVQRNAASINEVIRILRLHGINRG